MMTATSLDPTKVTTNSRSHGIGNANNTIIVIKEYGLHEDSHTGSAVSCNISTCVDCLTIPFRVGETGASFTGDRGLLLQF